MTLLKAFEQGNGSEQYYASRRLICCISKVSGKAGRLFRGVLCLELIMRF